MSDADSPFARSLAAALENDDIDEAERLLAAELGMPRAEVDVTRIDDAKQVHKTAWQGEPLKKHFRLEAFVARWPCTPKELDGIVQAVRARMNPGPNGFDAVAVCHQEFGRWSIGRVVEYGHSSLGARLSAVLPGVECETVPRDPFPPRQAAPPPADDYPTPHELLAHLLERPNVVLQGPPGSGKTRLALEAVRLLAGGAALEAARLDALDADALREHPVAWELVQMHPGFAYEDFVRGLAADEGAGLRFVPRDRVFLRLCAAARARGTRPTVLILDEMNRCDLSAVLGELIVAIDADRRGTGVRLQYPPPPGGEAVVAVPPNLWIIGTMNTADRSTALVDFAVRRRFRFLEVPASASQLRLYYQDMPARAAIAAALLDALGGMVERDGLAPGHSYLMAQGSAGQWGRRLARRLAYEVWPLLGEYAREGLLRCTELAVDGEIWGDVRGTPAEVLEDACARRLEGIADG